MTRKFRHPDIEQGGKCPFTGRTRGQDMSSRVSIPQNAQLQPGPMSIQAKKLIHELREFFDVLDKSNQGFATKIAQTCDGQVKFTRNLRPYLIYVDGGKRPLEDTLREALEAFHDAAVEIGELMIPYLKEVVCNDTNPLMRKAAVTAAIDIAACKCNNEGIEILEIASKDEFKYVRETAINALDKLTSHPFSDLSAKASKIQNERLQQFIGCLVAANKFIDEVLSPIPLSKRDEPVFFSRRDYPDITYITNEFAFLAASLPISENIKKGSPRLKDFPPIYDSSKENPVAVKYGKPNEGFVTKAVDNFRKALLMIGDLHSTSDLRVLYLIRETLHHKDFYKLAHILGYTLATGDREAVPKAGTFPNVDLLFQYCEKSQPLKYCWGYREANIFYTFVDAFCRGIEIRLIESFK